MKKGVVDTYIPADGGDNYCFDHWLLQFVLSSGDGENWSKDVFKSGDSHSVPSKLYDIESNKSYDPGNDANNIAACYADKITTEEVSEIGTFSPKLDYIYLYGRSVNETGHQEPDFPVPEVDTNVKCEKAENGNYKINFTNEDYSDNPSVKGNASFTFTPTNPDEDISFELYEVNGAYLTTLKPESSSFELEKECPLVIIPINIDSGLSGLKITRPDKTTAVKDVDYVVDGKENNTFYLKTDGCTISNLSPLAPVPMHLYMHEEHRDIYNITFNNLNIVAEKDNCEPFVKFQNLNDNCKFTIISNNTFDSLNYDWSKGLYRPWTDRSAFSFSFAKLDKQITIFGEEDSRLNLRGMIGGRGFCLDGRVKVNEKCVNGVLSLEGDLVYDSRCGYSCIDVEGGIVEGQDSVKLIVKDKVKIDAYSEDGITFYHDNCYVLIGGNAIVNTRSKQSYGISMESDEDPECRSVLQINDNANVSCACLSTDPIKAYGAGANFWAADLIVNTTGSFYCDGRLGSAIYFDDYYYNGTYFSVGTMDIQTGSAYFTGECQNGNDGAITYCNNSSDSVTKWDDSWLKISDKHCKLGDATLDALLWNIREK